MSLSLSVSLSLSLSHLTVCLSLSVGLVLLMKITRVGVANRSTAETDVALIQHEDLTRDWTPHCALERIDTNDNRRGGCVRGGGGRGAHSSRRDKG
jgi:hypothetical protein